MPLYEYECDACGHRFEVIQKYADAPIAVCPVCGGAVTKLFSSPAIQFKGSGFYITDYARAGKSDGAGGAPGDKGAAAGSSESSGSKESSAAEGSKSESKSDSKSETKSDATKSDTKSDSKSESTKPATPATKAGP